VDLERDENVFVPPNQKEEQVQSDDSDDGFCGPAIDLFQPQKSKEHNKDKDDCVTVDPSLLEQASRAAPSSSLLG
jgi:WD repeat-containing protein 70